jgi:hypothetical protein
LDARAALLADPDYYLVAKIQKVQPVQENGAVYIEVFGTVGASDFKEAIIDLGLGQEPKDWERVAVARTAVSEGRLGLIPGTAFTKAGKWMVRVQALDKNGKVRESRASIDIE